MEVEHRGRAGAALAVLVGLVVAASLVAGLVRVAPEKRSLAIVGNSITVVSMPAFERALATGYELDVAAALGVQVGQMQERAVELAARGPEVAVIELGSNDVLQGADLDETVVGIQLMADVLLEGGASCVHIVNASTEMRRRDGTPTGERARRLNTMTAALVDADERLVLVDWAGAVHDAQEDGRDLTPDSAHPDEAGAEVLAGLLADSLAGGCPAGQ